MRFGRRCIEYIIFLSLFLPAVEGAEAAAAGSTGSAELPLPELIQPLFIEENFVPLYVEVPFPSWEKEAARNSAIASHKTFPWQLLFSALVCFTLGAAAYVLGAAAWRRKFAPPPPSVIAWKQARDALQLIKRQQTPSHAPFETFWTLLSASLRSHLQERYGCRALTWTSEECLSFLTNKHGAAPQLWRDLLTEADQVKYATDLPSQELCQDALSSAKLLIYHPP